MHDVRIREATLGDNDAIAVLNAELGYAASAEEMRPRVEWMLVRGDENAIYVAEADGAVLGWIHVAVMQSLETGMYAQIRGLIVSSAMRGSGIGARLVARAEEWARSRGLKRMRVSSNVVRTRTHAFYEREGYATKKDQKLFEKAL